MAAISEPSVEKPSTRLAYAMLMVMSAPIKTRIFKSGNSKAVRLPSSFDIEPGTEVTVREENGTFVIEPVKEQKLIDLTGIAGSIPWLKPLSREEREFEEREFDWEGKLLERG